jgi:hypothetical protein
MGVCLHLYRVILGDELTLQYVMTPMTDKVLFVPMTYAAITGILLLVHNRVAFANKRHRALFTGSEVYIAASVPLHIYYSYVIVDTDLGHLVPDVVQLLPADPGVPGLPDAVLAPAI